MLSLIDFHFFFFTDPATSEIYTLSLHDALPILWTFGRSCNSIRQSAAGLRFEIVNGRERLFFGHRDRKSTRLNSSHSSISYAVFCLKKKLHSSRQAPTLC